MEYNPFLKVTEQELKEYNPFNKAQVVQSFRDNKSNQERAGWMLSEATKQPVEVVNAAIRNRNQQAIEQQALGGAVLAQEQRFAGKVEEMQENAMPPEEAAVALSEAFVQVPMFSASIDPAMVAFVMSSDNDLAKASVFNKLKKMDVAYNIASRKLEETNKDWWIGFDWATNILGSITPIYSLDSANKKAELQNRFVQLLESDISEEEFGTQFTEILNEAGDLWDWTSEGNRVSLEAFLQSASEGGEGLSSGLDKAFAAIDILSLANTGTLKATTALGSGIKAGSLSAGTDIARLAGIVRRDEKLVQQILETTAIKDDPVHSAAILGNHTFPSIASTNVVKPRWNTVTGSAAVRAYEEADALFNVVRRTAGPEAIDEVQFNSWKEEYLASRKEQGAGQIIDNDVRIDEMENILYQEVFGTKGGKAFNTAANAQKLANQIDGKVIPAEDGGFLVLKEENVPLTLDDGNTVEGLRLFKSSNTDELGSGFWANWGSPLAQTTNDMQALIVQVEATTARIQKLARTDLERLVRTMTPKEQRAVDDIFDDLQNGPDSFRRTAYTLEEFDKKFYDKYSRSPSDTEKAYYLKVQSLNDLDWRIKADFKFKDEVSKGTVVLQNLGEELNVRPASATDIRANELVWDADAKALVAADKIGDKQVYGVAADSLWTAPDGSRVLHVITSRPKTRRILPEDVMPYNPGGPRKYSDRIGFYVKQERQVDIAGGAKITEAPRTFMGVRTEAEAAEASRQINNVVSVIRENLKGLKKGASTQELNQFLRGLTTNRAIKNAIEKNSDWNINIQTLDDLVDFADSMNLDLREMVDWAADGTPLMSTRNDYVPGIDRNMTYGETFRAVGMTKGGRRDKPLIGFGGTPNRVINAVETINRSAMSSLAKKSEASYVAASVNGLIRSAIENNVLLRPAQQELAGLTLRGKLNRLSDMIDTKTLAGKKLKLERDKIEFRLNQRSELDSAWYAFKDRLAESLYGKGFKGTAGVVDRWSSNPATVMRGWLFDAYLGLGAWDQYYVQASQFVNVSAVADIDVAMKAGSLYSVTRTLISNGNENVIRAFGDKLGPIYGMSTDQFVEMHKMLMESGRTILDLSIAELGSDAGVEVLDKFRDKARFFFKEGELVSAITAHNVAYMELIKKFPDIVPNSQAGRRWIARRQNVLRQAMTFANRNPLQTLPMVQFLTYPWRVSEALFSGSFGGASRKVLTGKEKAKLAGVSTVVYGMTAVPFAGYVGDRIYQKYGEQVNPEVYEAMRYGMLDVILSEMTGAETALSTRLAWGEGVTQTVFNMAEANIIEALAGPSGQFTADAFGNLKNLMYSLRHGVGTGEYAPARTDLNLLMKQVKTWNLVDQMYWGFTVGQYYNRSGTKLVAPIDTYETIALGLGIPLDKLVENYGLQTRMMSDRGYEKRTADRLNRMAVAAEKAAREGDEELATEYRRFIVTTLNSFTDIGQRERIFTLIKPNWFPELDQTWMYAIDRELNTRNIKEGN